MIFTDMIVYYDGNPLLTDAYGNNASFLCPAPNCNHPVLLIDGGILKRGMSADRPAICRKCGGKYFMPSQLTDKIYIKSVGG